MNKIMKRRDALKIATVAGGLFAFEGVASAHPSKAPRLADTWLYQGLPCAIFQQGPVLICINESGSLATAIMTSSNTFVIQGGAGWDVGLVGQVASNGTVINWSNNTQWVRD